MEKKECAVVAMVLFDILGVTFVVLVAIAAGVSTKLCSYGGLL